MEPLLPIIDQVIMDNVGSIMTIIIGNNDLVIIGYNNAETDVINY